MATVREYYDAYYRPLKLISARPGTLAEYRVTLGHWDRFRRRLPVDQITDIHLAEFAFKLIDSEGNSPATANKTIRHLLAILRHAAKRDGRTAPDWSPLKEPKRTPLAFTTEEFSLLLVECQQQTWQIAGLPAADWLDSLLRSIWFSGARIGAMLAVRRSDVLIARAGFYVRAEAQKQHADQFFPVDAATVESWRKIWLPERPLMWPLGMSDRTLFRRFRKIIEAAGLDGPTRKRFHRIRCSTASYLKAHGGNPTEQLGHSQPSVTRAYYDPRIVGDSTIIRFMPPLPQ